MSADGAVFQPPPNWGAKSFVKGHSPNPGGLSRYERSIKNAIQAQETPERVCAVVAAMQTAALAGDAKAASVYLKTVGAEITDSERIMKAVVALFEAKLNEARERIAIDAEVTP